MLFTIQAIKILLKQGLNQASIDQELMEIADNGQSNYFELTETQQQMISSCYYDDDKYDRAWKTATM